MIAEATAARESRRDAQQARRASAPGRTPVVYIDGLWLLPGFISLKPAWPDIPRRSARQRPRPRSSRESRSAKWPTKGL